MESHLQRTGPKELPSLVMGTVIVLAAAESAAQINALYGSDPSVTFYTHISDRFAPFHTKVINAMCAMRRTQNSGQTFAYHFEGILPALAEYAPSDHVGETEDSARGVRAPYSTFSRFSRLLGHFDFVAWTHYGLLRN